MLWGEPLKETALFMDRVRREAALSGRGPRFSLSNRPILAATDGQAWDRARAILDRVLINRGGAPAPRRQNVGSQRLLQAAAEAEVHDTCLWTPLAVATGAGAEMRQSLGTAVLFGMLGVTCFGLLFTPAFYTFIRKLGRKEHAAAVSSVSPALPRETQSAG